MNRLGHSSTRAFGAIDVEPGPVLYLALEDTARRLQTRLRKVLGERAETGDPNRFATARALVKHAGLAPREKPSGTFIGRTTYRRGPARASAGGLAHRLGSTTREPRLRCPVHPPHHEGAGVVGEFKSRHTRTIETHTEQTLAHLAQSAATRQRDVALRNARISA
jgi:hypothetical protein